MAKFEGKEFMFQLDEKEFEILMCKNCISSWGGTRKLPFAFTEQGVYMLMTVLRGELAVKQSRALIMTFKKKRECDAGDGGCASEEVMAMLSERSKAKI
jgi:hypothetical protein